MGLERWIAVVFLALSVVYGYASVTYRLLPFERNMPFLPNTWPMVLSVLGIVLSLILILAPKRGDAEEVVDLDTLRGFNTTQAIWLLVAMVLFALSLRPLGFIAATVAFLCGSGFLLGERKAHIMVPIALIGAFGIWYLVQELLGIFLRPWPWFMG